MKKVFLLILSCVSLWLSAYAQLAPYTFKHISSQNGLSNDFVLDMAIDGQGFVWVATESGLNRWTSNGNTAYKESNSNLVSDELTSLYYDKAHNVLWVGSREKGISLLDCRTLQFSNLTTKEGLASNRVTDIMPAEKGNIWIAYNSGDIDLYDYHMKKVINFSKTYRMSKEYGVRCLKDDMNGSLYAGLIRGGLGIVSLKDGIVKYYRHEPNNDKSLPGDNVRSICIDHLKNIWIATNGGLALFNPLTEEFTTYQHTWGNENSLVGDNIHWVTEMRDETLWIASDLGGISILDLHGFERNRPNEFIFNNITNTNSNLSSPNTRIVLEDDFGNKWIGNYSTGVDFIGHEQSNFQIIPYYNEVNGERAINRIYGIAADKQGNLWLGGENLLSLYQEQHITKSFNISSYQYRAYSIIYIIKEAHDGKIWMGINDEGVICFDPKTDSFKQIHLGTPNLDIHALYEDENGEMMIGSEDGIYICRNEYTPEKIKAPEWKGWNPVVYALSKDKKGRTWVGTLGTGLYILDKNYHNIAHLYDGHKLRSNNINQIYQDKKGGLWIATYHGLAYVKDTDHPENIILYDEKQGLADSHVRAIQQDKEGNIWVSTYTGISCLNVYQQKFRNYNSSDGVPIGGFVESASAITPDGTIYFSSPHGVCYFNPQLVKNDNKVSPIEIVSCEYSDKREGSRKPEIAVPDSERVIRLSHTQNTFRISFAVADYSQEGKVEYAYRMVGLDKAWYETEGENTITFRNIKPGTYTFQVKARLKNQGWDENHIASLSIVVAPPLWGTWYAKLTYAMLLIGVIFFVLRAYNNRLLLKNSLEMEKKSRAKEQELNNERLRFYTNIAHELRTPLTLIIGPLDDLRCDRKLSEPYHNKIYMIYRNAVQLLNLINQLMEFRKTETQNRQLMVSKGNLTNLVMEIGLRYKELNRNERVLFHIDVAPLERNCYFDAEVITIVLNNLLSNAMKYTPEGEIRLSLHTVSDHDVRYAEMVVTDTGYGIDAKSLPHIFERYYQAKGKHQASGTGIGLALVKSLADLHHGILEVSSKVGQGTSFSFRIPLDYTYPEVLHKESARSISQTEDKTEEEEEDSHALPILLVVEDNDDIRHYIAEQFKDEFKILEASNGKEGLELALKFIPNIIVSDIMMPQMDGIEMCKAIKEDIRTSHIPVILLTAKDSIQDKEEGYDSGADSYLTKPFSAKLLKSRIHNLLESRKKLAKLIAERESPVTAAAEPQSIPDTAPQLNALDEAFLSKLTALVEDNLEAEKIDIAFMTDRMNMSYSSFYRKVKALTELTPNEFVRKIKLRNSARLLLSGTCNVTEAALMTGFNNLAHFRDSFKTEFGMPPSEYSKQHKQK